MTLNNARDRISKRMWIPEKNFTNESLVGKVLQREKKKKLKKCGTECDFNVTVKVNAYKIKSLGSWEW